MRYLYQIIICTAIYFLFEWYFRWNERAQRLRDAKDHRSKGVVHMDASGMARDALVLTIKMSGSRVFWLRTKLSVCVLKIVHWLSPIDVVVVDNKEEGVVRSIMSETDRLRDMHAKVKAQMSTDGDKPVEEIISGEQK